MVDLPDPLDPMKVLRLLPISISKSVIPLKFSILTCLICIRLDDFQLYYRIVYNLSSDGLVFLHAPTIDERLKHLCQQRLIGLQHLLLRIGHTDLRSLLTHIVILSDGLS